MKNIHARKILYHLKHRYLTMNNVVIAVAFVIGASWVWGSIQVMQRNYGLQKELDDKNRQLTLVELETQTLAYEQKYYQSREYQELAVRERLGLAEPGEKALILPPNSRSAKKMDKELSKSTGQAVTRPSNFQLWMNFLFGANRQNLQN